MLSGSAILRVGVLLVVAAVLAGLVQMLRPHGGDPVEAPVSKPVPETGKAGSQLALPPLVTRPAAPVPQPAPQAVVPQPPAPQIPGPQTPAPSSQAAAPVQVPPAPTPEPARPPLDLARPAAPMTGDEAVDNAAETAGPRGVAVVDLNTGSVADLNGLKGGGMIGRAIVQKRPYASVGELLSKRVLSRAVYERIKDQVTVR